MTLIGRHPIRCALCHKQPHQLQEYIDQAKFESSKSSNPSEDGRRSEKSPVSWVRKNEGTFNRENNLFVCTDCYIMIGQPAHDIAITETSWKPTGLIVKTDTAFTMKTERNSDL